MSTRRVIIAFAIFFLAVGVLAYLFENSIYEIHHRTMDFGSFIFSAMVSAAALTLPFFAAFLAWRQGKKSKNLPARVSFFAFGLAATVSALVLFEAFFRPFVVARFFSTGYVELVEKSFNEPFLPGLPGLFIFIFADIPVFVFALFISLIAFLTAKLLGSGNK